MALDMNSAATNPNTPNSLAPPQQTVQRPNGTWAGGIDQMLKALMAGNDSYKNQQQKQQLAQGTNPLTTTGGPSVGQPMSLTPPQQVTPPIGGVAPSVANGASPAGVDPAFAQGAAPVGVDPVTQALMSPIPGVNGGGQF